MVVAVVVAEKVEEEEEEVEEEGIGLPTKDGGTDGDRVSRLEGKSNKKPALADLAKLVVGRGDRRAEEEEEEAAEGL